MSKTILKNRTAFVLLLLILVILISSIGAYFFLNAGDQTGSTAEIYQDGKLIQTISLSTVTEEYSFTVEGDHGAYNVITVRHGEIGITEASCPDELCVQMGFIHSPVSPITCLPNKVVIKIVNQNEDESDPDFISY